ncbi:winged helix-turn-helix transcriptional regulator [Candidatus Woesearchaeota archaeon]|nr:winged helix-turn-helix transcriptional regulator [Candidatus Woesearchaeota archaeon]
MFSLTENESKVINFLARNWSERISMNEVAKKLNLSPMGAYKILRKLEKQKILVFESIGQAKYYKLNFQEQIARKSAEFVFSQNELNSFAKVCAEDLKKLQGLADCVILFGSVLTKGINANDIDVFCVIKKQNYEKLRKEIQELQKTSSKKLQLVVQTFEDLVKNLKNKDPVLLDIIRNGALLSGQEIILEGISKCQ